MSNYTRRIADDLLDELHPHVEALSLYGPKGVGKTESARRRARSILALDLDDDVTRLRADPGLLTSLPGPLLVDEWQRWPESWDRVRRAVDAGAEPSRFLLTGSTAPRGTAVHSGAGRIIGLRMRPMSLAERGVESPTVSLGALLEGRAEIGGQTEVVLDDYVEEIVTSGIPAVRRARTARLRRAALDTYLANIVEREFPEQGYPVRRPEALRAWLAAYAAASSSVAKYSEILDAATPNHGDKPAKKTTEVYREALSGLWLLDPTPAWSPTGSHLSRLSRASKHQLADPALAARLLNLDAQTLSAGHAGTRPLRDGSLLAALFESLVTLDVQVYAPLHEAQVGHLRDWNGRREIDLIVSGLGGRLVALEVKLAATPGDRDVEHLLWLKEQLGDQVADLVIVTTGRHAYRRQDGVAVVPAALLGP